MQRIKIPDLAETVNTLGWSFWLVWVLANSVGWIVGMCLSWLLSMFIVPLMSGVWVIFFWVVGGMIVGINFGINQWFLIRPVRRGMLGERAKWWVVATVLGWVVGIVVVIGFGAGSLVGFTLAGLVIGIAVGLPQAGLIYTQYNRSSLGWFWLLAHTVAWTIGFSAIPILDRAVGFAVVGVISGAISGGALIWLIGRLPEE
jgi:hypothetical protein